MSRLNVAGMVKTVFDYDNGGDGLRFVSNDSSVEGARQREIWSGA
jgi:hypothetical protein